MQRFQIIVLGIFSLLASDPDPQHAHKHRYPFIFIVKIVDDTCFSAIVMGQKPVKI